MDNRNGLVSFGVLILMFAFTFVFGVDGIATSNLLYGIFALIGYIVMIGAAVFLGMLANKSGEALGIYYFSFAVITGIVFVWFLTRCGSLFQFWTP